MLIELAAIFMGKEIPLLLNPQHIVSIAKPTVGRRMEGWKLPEGPWTYIDMTTGAYHLVKGSYEEVRDKWEKALRNDCPCPTFKGNKMHWDTCWHDQTSWRDGVWGGSPRFQCPSIPCARFAGHAGAHYDVYGASWPNAADNPHGSWDNCGVPGKGDPVLILQQGDWHHDDCPAHGAPDGICVECTCTHLRHDPNNEPS